VEALNAWLSEPDHDYEKHYKLKEGDIFVEGGSHMGRHARRASPKVGSSGRVIAIEPSPLNIVLLREFLKDFKNITIVEKALWNKKGKEEFWLGEYQPRVAAGHTLKAISGIRENAVYVDVETDTLDNIFVDLGMDLGIETVNLLGWDIEGAETHALEGMSESLSSGLILNLALCFYHKFEPEIQKAIETLKSYEKYHFIEYDQGILYARRK